MNAARLPDELVWEEGHVAQVALVALADGEDAIVPPEVVEHLGRCPACTGRLGEEALSAGRTAEALRAAARPLASPIPARRPLPVAAVVAALVIAAAAAMRAAIDRARAWPEVVALVVEGAPVLARGAAVALRSASSTTGVAFAALAVAAALMLVVCGALVARSWRRTSWEGGAR